MVKPTHTKGLHPKPKYDLLTDSFAASLCTALHRKTDHFRWPNSISTPHHHLAACCHKGWRSGNGSGHVRHQILHSVHEHIRDVACSHHLHRIESEPTCLTKWYPGRDKTGTENCSCYHWPDALRHCQSITPFFNNFISFTVTKQQTKNKICCSLVCLLCACAFWHSLQKYFFCLKDFSAGCCSVFVWVRES